MFQVEIKSIRFFLSPPHTLSLSLSLSKLKFSTQTNNAQPYLSTDNIFAHGNNSATFVQAGYWICTVIYDFFFSILKVVTIRDLNAVNIFTFSCVIEIG
jgi:hypothetical protein